MDWVRMGGRFGGGCCDEEAGEEGDNETAELFVVASGWGFVSIRGLWAIDSEEAREKRREELFSWGKQERSSLSIARIICTMIGIWLFSPCDR